MLTVDIFCQVIDNFGDIGVVYRFANELYSAYNMEIKIRVILSSTTELTKLNRCAFSVNHQVLGGIEYITYDYLEKTKSAPSKVIIEAFGCYIPEWYLEKAYNESDLLINLEYLSCEDWAVDCHLMESPLGAKRLRKYFFIPGLSEKSGGVIISREKSYELSDYLNFSPDFLKGKKIGTIFSYEMNFMSLLENMREVKKNNDNKDEFLLLVMGEKSQNSFFHLYQNDKFLKVEENLYRYYNVYIYHMPFINQEKYDRLLSLTDFNFVRGEDSFVRGILSKVPFLWHAYLQEDFVHLDKVDAFLKRYFEFFGDKKYEELLLQYKTLMLDYNNRDSNDYLKRDIDYSYFLNNLSGYKEMNTAFSEHIKSNCNLIQKISIFINEKIKNL